MCNEGDHRQPFDPSQSQKPVRCPICKAVVASDSETYPFCSKRCRLVDLGQWFDESYTISREIKEDDEV